MTLFLDEGGVISGEDAETLMDTTQTRNLLIDELLEVSVMYILFILFVI